jgi:D-alanine-D-alanine ligase
MKIAVTYSSKEGLLKEYHNRHNNGNNGHDIPPDFFAEGDSYETIRAIMNAIETGGHEVAGIEADDTAPQKLDQARPDLVFNIAEGLFGDFRESYVPLACERLGLRYTGSDPLTLAICLNKARTKEILNFHSIPTPAWRVVYPYQNCDLTDFPYPAIIKPVAEGSSKGIFNDSLVNNAADARQKIEMSFKKYNEPVIIEKFLEGDEFTIAIWGNGTETEILPIVAINYHDLPEGANPIYSYEAKWIWDTPEKPLEIFNCPASLTYLRRRNIEDVVRDTYRVMHIKDWCRIDIRMDDQGIPHILELNPLPGILPNPEDNSCFPKAARTQGYSYEQMLNKVIEIACKRYQTL